jgi:hypothetical protein
MMSAPGCDATVGVGVKRFIGRHVTPGVKQASAPSVLREQVQSARKNA